MQNTSQTIHTFAAQQGPSQQGAIDSGEEDVRQAVGNVRTVRGSDSELFAVFDV